MHSFRRHPLFTGALILTLTGFISRLIGFFYRIYLSRILGEEGMGLYQLISPVLSLSFSLTAAGYQTAVSKLVAEETARSKSPSAAPLLKALSISFPLSLFCNWVLFSNASFLAARFLQDSRTSPMLRILSFSIPAAAVHACINGYFYGLKKTAVPASTQLLEQTVRVGTVFFLTSRAGVQPAEITVQLAIWGLLIGEIASMALSLFSLWNPFSDFSKAHPASSHAPAPIQPPATIRSVRLMHLVLPLTANRIALNLLQSLESVSLPSKLKLYGYDAATALSVYGVLTGMAMPLIVFPNALTGSVSVLLLPMIAESYGTGDYRKVKKYTLQTIRYCTFLGLFCMGVFLFTGRMIGNLVFQSELAGHFILTLSFLCPFLYLDTTLSSILQGLGMAGALFGMNVFSLLIRLAFVYFAVPVYGISGYLWGILCSQILLTVLYLLCLLTRRNILTTAADR